jgi:hypothetical protein
MRNAALVSANQVPCIADLAVVFFFSITMHKKCFLLLMGCLGGIICYAIKGYQQWRRWQQIIARVMSIRSEVLASSLIGLIRVTT